MQCCLQKGGIFGINSFRNIGHFTQSPISNPSIPETTNHNLDKLQKYCVLQYVSREI